MPNFFTKSSDGRNGFLLKMVKNEIEGRGFSFSATVDGRGDDRHDYVTIFCNLH